MKSQRVRVVVMAGPVQCNKTQFKSFFKQRWQWVEGSEWQGDMQQALQTGLDVVIDRDNCSHAQQNEVYDQVDWFNREKSPRIPGIDPNTQIVVLVCHPSCGYGNAAWDQLMSPQTTLEIPTHPQAYRVLDMDDGKTIHWNTAALTAAARQCWGTVTARAPSVAHATIPRQMVGNQNLGNLSLMSYNILWQPTSRCTWEDRKHVLIETFEKHGADILCLQEVGIEMYRDISMALPDYDSTFGITGNTSFGCATFFRRKKLQISSEAPVDYLPQRNTQHKKPRVVAHITVLQFRTSQQKMVVCNTHLLYGFNDYMEKQREVSVQEITQVLQRDEYNGLPQLMCGDFNSEAESMAIQQVLRTKTLVDTYQALVYHHPEMTVEPYQHGKPIAVDYMFATKEFVPVSVLKMPTIASMRRVQLPIPGFEGSDHLLHLADYRLE
jgi:endonuclease/exonuclease/phosphatase family metal-dependent hydrolase